MGLIADRLSDLVRKVKDLSSLRQPIRQAMIDGNKADRMAGVDADGRPLPALAASTAEHHRRHGLSTTPLVPHGVKSRVIADYVADVQVSPGRLSIAGSWPAFPEVEQIAKGGRGAPPRDVFGFSLRTIENIRELLRRHIQVKG